MQFTNRIGCVPDMEACTRIMQNKFAYEEKILTRLPDVWRQLLAAGSLNVGIVEDLGRPPDNRIVAFGASVFVTDQFMREAQSDPAPYLSARVIRRHLQGESPVLSLPAIRRANSGAGLNLIVLYHDMDRGVMSLEEVAFAGKHLAEAFVEIHSGYHVKEILIEAYSEDDLSWTVHNSAYRIRSDYSSYYESRGLPIPPPHCHPYLAGITREEFIATHGGTLLNALFLYTPPQFFFKPREQELLAHALKGETDEELGASLCVSLSAVKKRWSTIYERVEARQPELLPVADAENSSTGQKRGVEKRHHLLRYLRQHPEELRPVEQPSAETVRVRASGRTE